MVEFFKRLLWDESAFERYSRAVLFAAATTLPAIKTGQPVDWMAAGAAFLAGLIAAGQKNVPQP